MLSCVEPKLERYAEAHTRRTESLFDELRHVTEAHTTLPQMQVGRVEGALLRLLVKLTGAERVLEVGTFTGYSALMLAGGLAPSGKLYTLERDPSYAAIARRFFERSGLSARIELVEGPALESIARIPGMFDLVFIDADKENYPAYFDRLVDRVRSGGLIVVDNVLWSGRVTSASDDPETRAIQALNERMANDPRVEPVLLTVRDGITLARRV